MNELIPILEYSIKQSQNLRLFLVAAKKLGYTPPRRLQVIIDAVLYCADANREWLDVLKGKAFYRVDKRTREVLLFHRKRPQRRRRRGVELCGAKTRKGTPCQCLPEPGKKRCRFHGGLSTGPKTQAGRQAIVESNRRRAKQNPLKDCSP